MKRFEPYQTPSRVAELVEKARKFNQDLDAVDRAAGGRVQADCPLDDQLRTVISALVSGLHGRDWDCVAQGLAMLQDVELLVRSSGA